MILKLQEGGTSIPPLVSYQPVLILNNAEQVKQDTTDKKSTQDLTDKDLLEMLLKLNGLPNDMQELTNSLQNFYIDLLYSIYPNTSSIASKYILILNLMKVANFNKKEYDQAYSKVSENGGINELAINDRGLIFCINDKGDFKLLSIDLLKLNNEYHALTNSDLLNLRAYYPSLSYNNDILKVVKNGIGIETVTKMIRDNISNIGTNVNSSDSYARSKSKLLITGLENFIEAQQQSGEYDATVDDLYKGTYLTKDLAMQSLEALAYIYTTLPENAKTLLKTKTLNGTDNEAILLISTLINSTLSYTKLFSLSLDKVSKDSSKDSDKNSKDKSLNLSLAEDIQLDLGTPTKIPIVPGTSDIMITDAYMYPVTKKNGESVGITSLQNFANDSAVTGLFDFSLVTFGDLLVEMGGLLNIITDGTSIYKAYLPIDLEKALKGIITPNLTLLALLELARNKVKETGAKTIEEINKIYTDYNLPPLYILDGEFTNYYRPFGIMNGVALSDAFSDPNSARIGSPMLEEITDETDINNYWNLMKGSNTKEKFDSKGILNNLGFGDYLLMFKGLIFLPLRTTDRNYGIMVGGNDLTEKLATDNLIKYQLELRIRTYKPQGLLQL